jgi:hypothetical protein
VGEEGQRAQKRGGREVVTTSARRPNTGRLTEKQERRIDCVCRRGEEGGEGGMGSKTRE